MKLAFITEKELIAAALRSDLICKLSPPEKRCGHQILFDEVTGISGVPDLVLAVLQDIMNWADGIRTYSIEFKLTNWKRALVQAYRYRIYNNASYVVMDEDYVHRARKNIDRFAKYNIGLASVDTDGKTAIYYEPTIGEPFSNKLVARFLTSLNLRYDSNTYFSLPCAAARCNSEQITDYSWDLPGDNYTPLALM